LECKAGSGSPLYLMMQKRYETEVIKLSQNNPSFLQCYSSYTGVKTLEDKDKEICVHLGGYIHLPKT